MNSTQNLPFTMTTESVSAWLSHLSKLDTVPASQELYSTLKKLDRIKLETEDLASILAQLTPSVLHLSGNLNTLFLSAIHSDDAINRKSRKLARLNSQLIRSQCLAYCYAISVQELTKPLKTQAIFVALQLIGFSLKTNTLISEKPSATLWKKMGELYRLAADDELLEEVVGHKIPLFKNPKTIESTIKRNLFYFLIDFYRAPSDQLAKYYDIADQCAEHLVFSESANASFNFYWDTASSQFPQRGRPLNTDGKNIVFNTADVVQYIQGHLPASVRADPIFNSAWQKLTGYWEIIDSVPPIKPLLYRLETGLAASIEQLRHQNRISNIHRLSAQLPDANIQRNLELVPLEHQKLGYQTRWEETLLQQTDNLRAGTVYLLPAKNPQFFLTQIKAASLPDNLPVLLYSQHETPKFGFIRFTQFKPESENQNALIETLPGEPYAISVKIQTITTQAILIKKSSKDEGIILTPGKYTTGDRLNRSDRPECIFYLNRLIEANDHFRYYQLSSD
ncbi:MAG: hypothetical protein ACU85E_01690 [Gammaproteobacteria bacterium]